VRAAAALHNDIAGIQVLLPDGLSYRVTHNKNVDIAPTEILNTTPASVSVCLRK
jgi:hypothetical protein